MTPLQTNKRKISEKTKTYLQDKNWQKVLVFLVFVFLAFIFWLMQYYQQRFEVEITLPITYKNTPEQVVLSKTLPSEITMKISDKGTILFGYYLKRDPISLSLENIDLSKKSYYFDQSTLSAEIRNRLTGTTSLVSLYPESLKVSYLPLVEKNVPIELNGNIHPALGYVFADSIRIEPASVLLYGDSITLDTISSVKTAFYENKEIDQDIKKDIQLLIPAYTRSSIQKTTFFIKTEEYTEKSFLLPVKCINLPANHVVRFFPAEVELICNIPLTKYSLLKKDDLEVIVDYNHIKDLSDDKVSLSLTTEVDYLISNRFHPGKVDFLIEK